MKYPTAPSGSNPVPSKGAPKPTNASIAPATSRGQFPIATGPLRSPNSHPMKTMPLSKRHSIPDQRCYGGDTGVSACGQQGERGHLGHCDAGPAVDVVAI